MAKRRPLPFRTHRPCLALTRLTIEHLPKDGSLGRRRRFRKAYVLWRPDDRADRIYFLESGGVRILSVDAHGREFLQQLVGVGEPFGELCCCAQNSGTRTTFARATADTTALEVEYEAFVGYVQSRRDALTALVTTICIRLTDCETRTQVLAYRGAQERLGRLLLQLSAEASRAGGDRTGLVPLRVSHNDLAQMAAMSRPHVTVTLGTFRRHKLIEYARPQSLSVNVRALAGYLGRPRAETRI